MTEKKTYVSVVLPLKLDWVPCYSVPPGESVHRGDWVKVDFSYKSYSGVVYECGITPDTDPEKIKDLSSVDRGMSRVTEEEMRLWKMVADYYLCSIGEVFKAAYPSIKISQEELLARMQEKEREKRRKLSDSIILKIEKEKENLAKKKKKLEDSEKSAKKNEKAIAKLIEEIGKISENIIEFEKRLKEISLEAGGIGLKGQEDRQRTTGKFMAEIELTSTQQAIYEQALEISEEGKPVLIKGVTGSGKTEIYLKLAQKAMSEGKNVLYLVPEIAVSRQLRERLRAIFGEKVLTFHSEETAVAKREAAEKIKRSKSEGKQYIVLGTRSAVFLPHTCLGLIVVDEEHDSSYKQDSPAPRYNGRDAAVMLSTIHRCPLVMGSATPSLESVFNASCGKYTMLTLNSRYYQASEAEVEIIDTSAERKKNGMTGSFSKKLASRIEETLRKKEQVLILRARRAFSPVLQCPECGEILKCPHCNVSLSMHKNPDRMICHHCGFTATINPRCPKCGTAMQGLGSGTQKIEEEARMLFPQAKIARLDSDTSKTKALEIISKFNSGDTDILVGTQIVSKGFDFPRVTLSAVIAADSMLGIQDFKADEKAFQSLEQLRGRCGRRDKQGIFVIQTNQPEHPVYRRLAEGDSESFYAGLLSERQEFGYPPFTRLINLCIKDRNEAKTEMLARKLSGIMKKVFTDAASSDGIEMVSEPFSPPVDKIAGNHIRIIRLTMRKDRRLHEMKRLAARTVLDFEKAARCPGQVIIDVDPS